MTAPVREKAILVVDDQPELVAAITDMLRIDGHQVDGAANGVIALAKLEARTYDVILCDVRMPDLDGVAFHRELGRRHPRLVGHLVFIVGDVSLARTGSVLPEGVPVLSKPFRLADLRRAVAAAAGGAA